MKKLFSLVIVFILLATTITTVPIISAEEAEYTFISAEMREEYWSGVLNDGIIKIGNWYYGLNIDINTGKKNIYSVCGYDGNETVITIPSKFEETEINCIQGFYVLSDTVETVIIPKEIKYINSCYDKKDASIHVQVGGFHDTYFNFDYMTNFKEIIVDSENDNFESIDGVLFSKSGRTLYFYPPEKTGKEYIVPSSVVEIAEGALYYSTYLKSLTIPPSVEYIYPNSISLSLKELYYYNIWNIRYKTMYKYGIYEDDLYFPMPQVSQGTIYCIENTPIYEYYADYNNSWDKGYYFKELKTLSPLPETLVKEDDGQWNYYYGDCNLKRNTLVKYNGKWFYVKNGKWDKTFSDEIISYNNKKFYIKNGKWSSGINTLVKVGGEWLGIVSGKFDTSAKTLIKYKGKWFYVKNGKWCKDTAIVKYKGKRFYVKNGKVDFDYSGKKKIDGKTYKIKNGKVA